MGNLGWITATAAENYPPGCLRTGVLSARRLTHHALACPVLRAEREAERCVTTSRVIDLGEIGIVNCPVCNAALEDPGYLSKELPLPWSTASFLREPSAEHRGRLLLRAVPGVGVGIPASTAALELAGAGNAQAAGRVTAVRRREMGEGEIELLDGAVWHEPLGWSVIVGEREDLGVVLGEWVEEAAPVLRALVRDTRRDVREAWQCAVAVTKR